MHTSMILPKKVAEREDNLRQVKEAFFKNWETQAS